MNKKPGLFLTIAVLAIIILAASYGFHIGGDTAVRLPSGINPGDVLYVCPANDGWTTVANSVKILRQFASVAFAFVTIILVFSWSWALYQNLLKDKFSEDVYKNPWGITKVFFWAAVICVMVFMTPNHFRKVSVRGHGDNWVLCENTSPHARAVKPSGVTLPEK